MDVFSLLECAVFECRFVLIFVSYCLQVFLLDFIDLHLFIYAVGEIGRGGVDLLGFYLDWVFVWCVVRVIVRH